MENGPEVIVPVVVILVVFGMPMAYALATRYYAHQERLEMIRRGTIPPQGWRADPRPAYAPPQPDAWAEYHQYQAQAMLAKGITVGCVGFALLIGLSFIDPGHPGPWLLGGLIPLAIGAAQIVIALLSGARQPAFRRPPPPPQPPGEFAPGAPGYRPGPTIQIEPPSRPPDNAPR